MNIWKRRVTKRRLLPQRFDLPSAREVHGGDVDGRVSSEQSIDLRLHVVDGRNDVEEILDDAKAEIDFPLVDRNSNPRAGHAVGEHRTDGVLEWDSVAHRIKIKRPAHLSIVKRLGGFSCVQR